MRTALAALAIIACSVAACSSSSNSKSTRAAGTPTAHATSSPNSPAAGAATTAASVTANSGFPARCSAFVVSADIDALAAQHLSLADDTAEGTSGVTSQLVCRFQGTGAGGDSAIIVVAARYADAPTATREDRILRSTAEAQGGKFTQIPGLEDEAYSLTYPSVTGAAARRGNVTVSIGVGKLLGVPATAEYSALIKSLLSKLGN